MNRKTDAQAQLRGMVDKWPEAQDEYERLGPRYAAISELIRARKREKLSQAELANRMGVSPAALNRLESAVHSPRLDTLAEAARAMGQRLVVRFVRTRSGAASPEMKPTSTSRTRASTARTKTSASGGRVPARRRARRVS